MLRIACSLPSRQTVAPMPALGLYLLITLLAAGCTKPSGSWFPLEDGHWWQYDTTATVLGETTHGRLLVSNLGDTQASGQTVYAQRVQRGLFRYYRERDDGTIERVATRDARRPGIAADDPPRTVIPGSDHRNQPFPVPSMLRVVESKTFARQDKLAPRRPPVTLMAEVVAQDATVTVPAGRFTHCLLIESRGTTHVPADRGNASARVDVTQREWFAPGVGLVLTEREEASTSPFLKTGHYRQALVSYR